MRLSLLKIPFGQGIGFPTKISADESRLFERSVHRCCDLSTLQWFGAPWNPRKAIAAGDDARHRDGGAGLVTVSGSGCATLVAMVQTADLWEGDNGAGRGWLYGPRLRTILAEREMRAASVVVLKVCRQHTAQVTLIEDDDVIEAFAADRADDSLDIGVLPW